MKLIVGSENINSHHLSITGDQARHLALVLRVKPDDCITVLDGNGYQYECRISSVHKKEVTAEVIEKSRRSAESDLNITLVQGLPKGDKMDFIIQKSTELGVQKIIPVITERSQVRHTKKVERWRKIAFSAAQQSGRNSVPDIAGPITLDEFLSRLIAPEVQSLIENIKEGEPDSASRIILSEGLKERNLKKILSRMKGARGILLLVGPEGGFSAEEVSMAVEKGFTEVSLGPRILRTETAPIAAISIIQYELGDM